MPNAHYKDQSAPASSQPSAGSRVSVSPIKDSGFPGVPGQTQPKNRSNGVPQTGKLGPFHVRKEGI